MDLNASSFKKWPSILPRGCQRLINEGKKKESINASQSFDVDSTIEIRPMTKNCQKWKIFLRRDGTKCYQKYGKKNKNIQKFIDYKKRVIEEYKQDDSGKLNYRKENENIPKLYKCKQELIASKKTCGFYVYEPYCIIRTDTYYAAARLNKERVIIVCPCIHENNESWV
jgi:hypothetical protein